MNNEGNNDHRQNVYNSENLQNLQKIFKLNPEVKKGIKRIKSLGMNQQTNSSKKTLLNI